MLTLDQVSKSFGDRAVLVDLSLRLEVGEVYGLLGANGAGKTTTINLICNLLRPDRGTITLGGKPISDATKGRIGIAPQENLLYKSLSCVENLRFFAAIYGVPRRDREGRIREALAAVNLVERADSPVETLSGGMQRRLNTAVAIVHRPDLLILDEPTTGLDLEARHEFWDLIRTLRSRGMTILLTTHLLDEAERLCQHIGILQRGKLLASGTLAELRQAVPAAEVATIETPDEAAAIARAEQLNWPTRHYGGQLAFWVPERLSLAELLAAFEGIAIDSIARHPVNLEHVYLELTRSQGTSP
ncbi:MAG: ABC transporter ATP-binding protein [Cyanobacteria bacterium]|nr:ABC transporter ATP-binding protein [Cyanobacteriota bacterium]